MFSRRQILQSTSAGFGYLAFAGMTHTASGAPIRGGANPLKPTATLCCRANKVISYAWAEDHHVDSFDYKPELERDHGKSGRYGGNF